jgi:hypothetical protein
LYTDIIVSIGWTAITFIAGWSGRKWTKHRQETRPAAKVWKIDPKTPVHIVTADPPSEDLTEFTPIVYPAEYAAATELSVYLTQVFQCKIRHICTSSDFPRDSSLEENIVVIGGPNHNPIYKTLYGELEKRLKKKGKSLPYQFNDYDLIRTSDGHAFSSEVEDNQIVYDIGLVMLAPNPFNENARVVFLAGCRTYGCLAAARAVESPHILKTAEIIRNNEIEAFVVGASIIGQYLSKLDILDPVAET